MHRRRESPDRGKARMLPDHATMVVDHKVVMSDPMLFVTGELDAHLLAGSTAVNAGSADMAPAIDRDGWPRPWGNAVDLGAYEWHEPGADAGLPMDGSMGPADAGARDVIRTVDGAHDGSAADAGTMPTDRGGCGCRAVGTRSSDRLAIATAALAMTLVRRRRRRA